MCDLRSTGWAEILHHQRLDGTLLPFQGNGLSCIGRWHGSLSAGAVTKRQYRLEWAGTDFDQAFRHKNFQSVLAHERMF
jgi:hypothetical protein